MIHDISGAVLHANYSHDCYSVFLHSVVLDHIANDTPWQEVEESHKQMQRLVFCTPAGDEVSVGAKRYYAVLSTTWSVLCAKLNTGKIICCMCNTNKCRHYKNVMGDLPQDEGPDSAEVIMTHLSLMSLMCPIVLSAF